MSSMRWARFGKRSETSMPLLPYRLNVRFVPSNFACLRDELIFRLAETRRALLAVQLVEQWFGIERLQMAGATTQEKEDH